MRKYTLVLPFLAAGILATSCNKMNITGMGSSTEPQTTTATPNDYFTRTFAQPDDAELLDGTPQENLKALFTAAGPEIINSLGSVVITDEQYQEIKTFTDNLVASKTTEKDKYNAICEWVHTKVKYNNPQNNPENRPYSNDAYEVFKNRFAVCQGYSNLMVVMCMTQGIPAVVINGYLNYGSDLGHAWMYGCPDDTWYVSDPTNGINSRLMKFTAYYSELKPMQADVDIFKDDYAVYNYYDGKLNVKTVLAKDFSFAVPYSVGGFVIGSFNPSVDLPEGLTEIYLGQNIMTMGEPDAMNLSIQNFGRNLQAIYVHEDNPSLMDHKGVVYRKNGDTPELYYIPGGMTSVELLPMETIGKNTICHHKNVKEIYFPEGTKRLDSWAVEDCPKLERVYVPEDAEISSGAFPKNVEIIRGIPSGIKNITM